MVNRGKFLEELGKNLLTFEADSHKIFSDPWLNGQAIIFYEA